MLVFCGCAGNRQMIESPTTSVYEPYINEVKKLYAPDQRTVHFVVQPNGNVMKGESTSSEAKAALLEKLANANLTIIDSITLLPSAELTEKSFGLVTISVANLRFQPNHKAELATQAMLGTPVRIFKKEKGWYYVQTPDKYLAWVDGDAIVKMDSTTFVIWYNKDKIIYTQPYGFAYSDFSDKSTVSDLVYGDVFSLISASDSYYKVKLPDDRIAYIDKKESLPYHEWKNTRQPTASNLVSAAKQMTGLPYLWGGTSFKGVDCSGFTKTVFFMNGLVLARDASQQVNMGEYVDTKSGWQNMQPGDLLFFGSPARDSMPERVVHVGMWIGNNEFMHASGKVRISSMDPTAANYDAYENKRFLRAKRISPQAALLDLRASNLY